MSNKEYLDPSELPSLEEVSRTWCDTDTFATLKETDADTVRSAARAGKLEATKLFGSVLYKRVEFSEKNAAWVPGEGKSTRTRDDGRRRFEMYALDEEIAGIKSDYPDVEIIDLRARNAAARAAKKAEKAAEAPAPPAVEDTLDTGSPAASNPFANL